MVDRGAFARAPRRNGAALPPKGHEPFVDRAGTARGCSLRMREFLILAISDRQRILPLLIACGSLQFVALVLPKSWLRTAAVYASGAVIGGYSPRRRRARRWSCRRE